MPQTLNFLNLIALNQLAQMLTLIYAGGTHDSFTKCHLTKVMTFAMFILKSFHT